jgi:hypothetical protein
MVLVSIVNVVLAWGWLFVVILLLWIIWRIYLNVKMIEYVSAIQWTFLQVTVPEESEQTPKAMENAFDTWDGIHKNPDLIERFFEGYLEAWYSCEIYCTKGKAQYIMVVPTVHRTFFEGVIYGQYPQATVTETADYTRRYAWQGIDKEFDLYGAEIILSNDDYMPVKTYHDYEDTLAEEERFVDPHQALVEAYTNIEANQEFWVQILVRPIDPKTVQAWEESAEAVIDELAGKEPVKKRGIFRTLWEGLLDFFRDLVFAAVNGPLEAKRPGSDGTSFPRVSEADRAKADGILRKVSHGGYKTKIRVIHLAPLGELHKPNISRAIGAFKQFNTYHLNSFRPDPDTKTNGPNYIAKIWRRYWRKRRILLYYQWRDFWGIDAGYFLSGEELATLYHFPTKYARAPSIERSKAGLGSAPENIPYVE